MLILWFERFLCEILIFVFANLFSFFLFLNQLNRAFLSQSLLEVLEFYELLCGMQINVSDVCVCARVRTRTRVYRDRSFPMVIYFRF
jgi:hypothetical protein